MTDKIFLKNSTTYKSLKQVCEQNDINIDNVNQLLWSINCEPNLSAFIRILQNLKFVIDAAKKNNWYPGDINIITPWFDEVIKLLNISHELVNECGDQLIKKQSYSNGNFIHALYGELITYPLYAALWNRADVEQLRKQLIYEGVELKDIAEIQNQFTQDYLLIQWNILLIHIFLFEEYVNKDNYLEIGDHELSRGFKNSLNDSCASIRKLSHAENYQILNRLVCHKTSIGFFLTLADSNYQGVNDIVRSIRRLAIKWKVSEGELKTRKSGSRRRNRGISKRRNSFYVELIDSIAISNTHSDDDSAGHNIRTLSFWNDNDEWDDSDLAIEEAEDQSSEGLLVRPNCKKRGDIQEQVMAAIGAAHKREVLNQRLPISEGMLTIAEVADAMHRLLREARRTEHINRRRAAIFGILLYWTGAGFTRVRNLIVARNDNNISDEADFVYLADMKCWRIRVPIYKPKKKPTLDQKMICRKCGEYLFLPDMFGLFNLIELLLNVHPFSEMDEIKPFIMYQDRTYEKSLKDIFRGLDIKGFRVTPNRLSGDLYKRLLSQGDPMMAMAITGQSHQSSETIRHYSTPSSDQIADYYQAVVQNLLRKIKSERQLDLGIQEISNAAHLRPRDCVGAEFCPTSSSVKAMLGRVRELISTAETYQAYHNYFAIYTALSISYCTGYRAVRGMQLDRSRRDIPRGFAWISDKNDAENYHTRIVWVPPILEQQLQAYEAHRRIIHATWEIHFPNVERPSDIDYLFIVDHNQKKPVPISPATMAGPLAKLEYPLPLNSNRRWLRTELSERNCPIDVINAVMGHWSLGEEPFGPYSSFSPRYFKNQLEQSLQPMLEEINLRSIKSKWVSND